MPRNTQGLLTLQVHFRSPGRLRWEGPLTPGVPLQGSIKQDPAGHSADFEQQVQAACLQWGTRLPQPPHS